jgi:hypothetical protein
MVNLLPCPHTSHLGPIHQEVTLLSEQLSWAELFEEIDRDGPALTDDMDTAELIRQERERELDARSLRDVPPE